MASALLPLYNTVVMVTQCYIVWITIATAAGLVLAELIEEEESDDVILSPLA